MKSTFPTNFLLLASPVMLLAAGPLLAAGASASSFPSDPNQILERTCFQTGGPWSEHSNLRSDVAIVYGIDTNLPGRIQTWRDHGYRIHVMTGVSWGNYQDYLYGRFDGINHEDEAQTVSDGRKSSHGGDVYYMCPGTNYGKFLCVGVQRALDAGAEAIHLEEPEFWVNSGYSEGFKREWRSYYGEPWKPPHSSVDAQWRASKLKYFLYRRALQQVFDYVQDFNKRTGKHVRCYVPTHSLLNYSSWNIVSPESSLARLNGCDGYIAQVWTGTARTPNLYRGKLRERTFETAFLEYGAMQNLVRATGRSVWYLNDPIEDNANHDWDDYKRNWECTLTASLFQPEVWQYEVAPWPERIFNGRYPHSAKPEDRKPIPPAYATELQVVMNALNDLRQDHVEWDCGTGGIGVLVSDSLMFQRGDPKPSETHLSHFYGLAMPLLKRGIPVAPVQLENVTVRDYLKDFRVLLLTYQGMKPLSAEVHAELADWVKRGGALLVADDDSDPFNAVRDWWNSNVLSYSTPREHLFEQIGITGNTNSTTTAEFTSGRGRVIWLRENPVQLAKSVDGDTIIASLIQKVAKASKLAWRETNYLLLRRGPYLIAAGLDESIGGEPKTLQGKFVDLFDSELRIQKTIRLEPGSRFFLRDLEGSHSSQPEMLASACRSLVTARETNSISIGIEGVAETPAVVLLRTSKPPRSVALDGGTVKDFNYSAGDQLLWIRFANEPRARTLTVSF
ncbi:MAG TPA: hypothetical protein VK327_12130 [Candidatus Paceibacterota bacterium]|nr:hypothetical protein [Candidatus Paceibacterota bacterium]